MPAKQELQVQKKREHEQRQESTIPARVFVPLADIYESQDALTVIENWLAMSQNFMQMSIKTLELQKASLEALRAGSAAAGGDSAKR